MVINREQFDFNNKNNIKTNKLPDENLIKLLDENKDGKITGSELNTIFDKIDKNKDGNITDLEIENAVKNEFSSIGTSVENIKNFLLEALNKTFKAKGQAIKSSEEDVLVKENGAEIIKRNDGGIIIKTPKQTQIINGNSTNTYSITTKSPDGSFIVELFEEDIDSNKTCNRMFYDTKGKEISKETVNNYQNFTIKENIKNNVHKISYRPNDAIGTTGLQPHSFQYSVDDIGTIINQKNNSTASINPKNFEDLFDENGNFKKDIKFPIKTEIYIKLADGSSKTIEVSIEDEKAIKYQSTATQNKNMKELLNNLCGNITYTIANLEPAVLEDLIAEINILEIANQSKKISSGSDGEYMKGSDIIRLHTSSGGLNSSTLTHELGHAIDDKVGNYISESKLTNLLEELKTTTKLEADPEKTYCLTNSQEFFAEWYKNKYIKNESPMLANSEGIFNDKIKSFEAYKKLDRECEELLKSIRNDNSNRKSKMIKIDYDDKTINDFILEYYDELNNIHPIYVAKDLRTAMATNPQIREIYEKNIENFVNKNN